MRGISVGVALSLTACLVPANEVLVGRLDAGFDGGAVGSAGGAAGGSAQEAAGGSSGGGGQIGGGVGGGLIIGPRIEILLDAGVINSVGTPPSICSSPNILGRELLLRVPRDAGCGNGCLFELVEDAGLLVFRSDLGAPGEVLAQQIATGENFEAAVLSQIDSGQKRLVAIPLDGGSPVTIQQLPVDATVAFWGTWNQDALFFTESNTTLSTGSTTHSFKVWGSNSGVKQLSTLPTEPRGRPYIALFALQALLVLEDGVYASHLTLAAPPRQLHQSSNIEAWVAHTTGLGYFSERIGADTALYVVRLGPGQPSATLIGLGLGIRAFALNVQGEGVDVANGEAVLTNSGVYLVSPLDRTARLIYGGPEFSQGLVDLNALTLANGKYYVGQLCHADAASSDWGTVELTPPEAGGMSAGGARWITGTPEWPFATPALDRSSTGWTPPLRPHRTVRNGFVYRHVGE